MTVAPFVDAAWVLARRRDVVVADVRWYPDGRSGAAAYAAGHVPGAIYVDLDGALAVPPAGAAGGRHPLPSPEQFAVAMAAVGIGDDDVVVAYDDAGGSVAARLVWMLRGTGHAAALLDGGLAAWPESPVTEPATRPPAAFTARPWPPDQVVGIDELDQGTLLDVRAAPRYRGEVEPLDPRAGHIPGARNVPFTENLADGRLKSVEELRQVYEHAGFGPDDAVVVYCGSGVTACLAMLALEAAGYDRRRLFPGSWSQWSNDPSRAVATGDD